AVALLSHRSAVVLIPSWILGLMLVARGGFEGIDRRRAGFAAAAALPLVAALIAGPTIWRIVREFDLQHHLATTEVRSVGFLAATLAPLHLLDLTNIMLIYVPLLPPATVLAVVSLREEWRKSDRKMAAVLAVSTLPLLLFIHPIQGI